MTNNIETKTTNPPVSKWDKVTQLLSKDRAWKLRSLFATVAAALLIAVAIASPAQHVAQAQQQTACATLLCDRDTLLAIKNTLLANPTPDEFNWSADLDIRSWYRVDVSAVNSVDRVTALRLNSQQIGKDSARPDATIPADIGKLSELTKLLLNGNGYTGSIPPEIGNLTNLTHLHLQNNTLTGLIPTQLGSLTNLIELNIAQNDAQNNSSLDGISGPIPTQLGGLSKLKILRLQENSLSGDIPAELGNMAALEELRLSNNQLTESIPAELGDLSNLTSLRLTVNELSGDIPPELGSLANLTRFSLGGNKLTGSIPKELGSLSNVTIFSLLGNKLTGSIPKELGNLTAVTGLDLRKNSLDGPIPKELGNLSNLTGLLLSSNSLDGLIPKELGDLTNLTGLYLDTNSLTGTIPAGTDGNGDATGLAKLDNMTRLWLHNNQLSGSIPPALGKLSAVTHMYLHNNQLSGSIPLELKQLSSTLRALWLRDNDLIGSIPPEIGDLTKLSQLLLQNNKLTGSIPTEIGNLTTLGYLWLHNNKLTGQVPTELGRLTGLAKSTTTPGLYLSGNDFICVPTSLYTSLAFFAAHLKDLNTLDDGEAQLRDCHNIPAIRRIAAGTTDSATLTAKPGDKRTLSVTFFGHNNDEDKSLADSVPTSFTWSFSWLPDAPPRTAGPSFTYTAPSEPGTYTVKATLAADECVGYNYSADCTVTFEVTILPPDQSPLILRIVPVVEAVVLSAEEQVRLKVDIYGLQKIQAQSLADDVTFEWKTSTGSIPENSTGAHVVYTASTTPGSDTVTVSLNTYECMGTDKERSGCTAEFQITVRRQSPAPTATPEPQNPAGTIPSAVGTLDGRTCEVFTPKEGGTFRGDGFTFSAGPASVQNGEYIAICMEESANAEANRSPQHRYTLYGSTFDIAAYDAEGNRIVHYALNSSANACIPLPPAIRSRIDDISMVSVNPDDTSLTAHSSSLRLHSDGDFRVCGTLATLPITIAAASLGPPQTPTPEPTPEPTAVPPDTGASAPSQSPLILALILALLTMSIGAYILLTPRNKTR